MRAHAHHVHLGQGQFTAAARHHGAKHFTDKTFLNRDCLLFPDDILPPEGEEHSHFLATGCCSVGDDEGCDGLIQISAKYDQGTGRMGGEWYGCIHRLYSIAPFAQICLDYAVLKLGKLIKGLRDM
jgi:hypothetical protein